MAHTGHIQVKITADTSGLMRAVDDAARRRAATEARAAEARARALITRSLPRGLKWMVEHPRLLRAAYKVRLLKRPTVYVQK